MSEKNNRVREELKRLSDSIDPDHREVSIILAAGHGKRIKSEKSKMLHEIWGKPSVYRVCKAASGGLSSENQVVVVGKKALEVAHSLGKRKNRVFVYQAEQRGTGDAVRVALKQDVLHMKDFDVYIFPGDMGLLTEGTVSQFKNNFKSRKCDMFVLTGYFEGRVEENYYGRILKSRKEGIQVIEIKEYRDILAMDANEKYSANFRDKIEFYTREELLQIREFNTGVYAFRIDPLKRYINSIKTDNVQGEIYVTDLIKIFNNNNLRVCSAHVEDNNLVVAFNVKSTLKRMEETFRQMVYEQLKDIITIDDPEDFYIAEETVSRILELDKKYNTLEITLGKGAFLGENVEVNRGLKVERNAILKGNVRLGENVVVGENVIFSNYPDQLIDIGNNNHIFRGNIIQGNVKTGDNVRIESGVRITGNNEEPVKIGNNVTIKGMTYVFGSSVEDDILIEHSILKSMYVERVVKKNGEVQPIKYILPHPEGLDSLYHPNKYSRRYSKNRKNKKN